MGGQASQKDAVVAAVKGEQLVTGAVPVKTLDLATMTAADADFTADFTLLPLVRPRAPPCASLNKMTGWTFVKSVRVDTTSVYIKLSFRSLEIVFRNFHIADEVAFLSRHAVAGTPPQSCAATAPVRCAARAAGAGGTDGANGVPQRCAVV